MDLKVNVDRVSNGLYVLFIGFLFLWMSLGFVKWNMIFQLLRLWPLLFVMVGLDLILKRTSFNVIRIFIPLVVIAVVLGLINVAQNGNLFHPRVIEQQIVTRQLSTPEKSTDINLRFASGKLRISDGGNDLIWAALSIPQGAAPGLNFKSFDKDDLYEVTDGGASNYIFSPWDADHLWDFRLNKDAMIKINAKTNDTINEIDLSNLSVSDLNFDTNFSATKIIVAPKSAKMNINANMSYLTLEIPKKIGVKIKLEKMYIMDNFADLGLTQSFKEYVSSNYGESEKKVDINLNMKLSKLEIRFY